MQIKWRGLELPSRVIHDDTLSSESYGRFVIEPFEQGFGTTIGNSLRRVLLASLEGAAATSVKIAGVLHEFTSMEGVLEDVTDIILNVKGIRLKLLSGEPKTMSVRRETKGEICAGDFVCDPAIQIANPEHRIATLTTDGTFEMVATVRTGRGYATANDNRLPELELGVIPVDSVFSPVLRVRYRTEAMRVGQQTNYDRLILEIWTNSAITPEDALVEAGLILRRHLNPFVMYHEMGEETTQRFCPEPESGPSENLAQVELLSRPIAALNLSVRSGNCLDAARVATIGDLVNLRESDLLRFRSFGKTSLHEVHRKLAEFGLSLVSDASAPQLDGAVVPDDGESETGGTASPALEISETSETPDSVDPADSGSAVEADSEPTGAFTRPD